MRKYLIIVLFFSVFCFSHGQTTNTGRFWSYLNLAGLLSDNWSYVAMPGIRYEFSRCSPLDDEARGFYFFELLTGPVLTVRYHRIQFRFPLWYYYMGFPDSGPTDYCYSHNIEFMPIVEYRSRRVSIMNRVIFNNKIYASVYDTPALRMGYGLVIRNLFQLTYLLSSKTSLILGIEPFFGVIEDSEAPPHALGFWAKGFRMNRIYAGLGFRPLPSLVISPQYILETNYDQGRFTGSNHYFYLTFNYTIKFFKQ
jgi:hypothetical protein